jgi:hypothetical protein
MADELDMVNRDPNGMNIHVQVIKKNQITKKSQQLLCKKKQS